MISPDWPAIIALFSGVLYLPAAGLAVTRRAVRPRAALLVASFAACAFFWALTQSISPPDWLAAPDGLFERLPAYVLSLLAILLWFTTRAFLQIRTRNALWLFFAALWALVLGVFEVFSLTSFTITGQFFEQPWAAQAISIVGWTFFSAAAAWGTLNILRQRYTSRYFTSAQYWTVALAFILAGGVLYWGNYHPPGNILHLFGALFAVYIITTARLPGIAEALRHIFSYLVYITIAIAIYAVSIALLQLALQTWTNASLLITGLALASLLVLLLNPLLNRIRREIDFWVAGEEKDPSYVLRQYSQTITDILDLKLLAAEAIETASEFLEVRRGYLFLVHHEHNNGGKSYYQLNGVKGKGETNPQPLKMRADSALANYLCKDQNPVTHSEIDLHVPLREITTQEKAWLKSLNAEVYTPIFAKNEWIGLIALGPKTNGGVYTEQDLSLLSTLADQTAVALENTRLVDGLVRLNNDFRRAYTALDQANRHLERLDRTKSDFISIASHELRTPLTLIRGSSQMLLDDPDLTGNPYYQQLLSKIEKGADRLHEIVESLLDMAKIDTRALELDQGPVSVNELIQSVCRELKKSAEARNQTIDTKDLEALPPISADMAALKKGFYHLIINAIKYTPDGGTITIAGKVEEQDITDFPAGSLHITIADSGIGIDPRYHELIFTKFYQTGELALHSSGKTKFKGGGPGLGLAITRGIIAAHRGKVWVESPGHDEEKFPGSIFHIVLPPHETGEQTPLEPKLPKSSSIVLQ